MNLATTLGYILPFVGTMIPKDGYSRATMSICRFGLMETATPYVLLSP